MQYSKVTQSAIGHIEANLTDTLYVETIAALVGYSKFHLIRVFKQEVGMAIGEYIRMRRLATAAMMLLHSDEPLLMIALTLQFQSQEAFTRAFHECYGMPPGKYRKLMSVIIKEEEQAMSFETPIKGWFLSGSHPWNYTIEFDDKIFHSGTKSGLLQATDKVNEIEGQFATMMQSFLANHYRGKRLKLICYIKTEQATRAAAWCRVDNSVGDSIQFDNMDNRPITGTTDWNVYSIVLDVPEESESIHFGILLVGKGKVWADGFKFEIVDEKTPLTNSMPTQVLPEQPINLDFSL